MSSWTPRPRTAVEVNYVHVKTADVQAERSIDQRQGYQVLTPFGKLGYSPKSGARAVRLSDRRLQRWLAGTSTSAASSHGAADLLGLNRAHICVRNLKLSVYSGSVLSGYCHPSHQSYSATR